MEELVINFKDYTKVADICISQKQLDKIKEQIGDDTISIDSLCDEIQDKINVAKKSKLQILNELDEDDNTTPTLFSFYNGERYTKGYCGIVKIEIAGRPVTVKFDSRFDDENSSNFLMYLFEKAYQVNAHIFEDMHVDGKKEVTWDFLLMIVFFNQFQQAMNKGPYRQYQEYEHNDSNVKGRIDVARHIKENAMLGISNGKISYVTREYTVDNDVNRLIIKALNCLKKRYPQVVRRYMQMDTLKKDILFLQNEVQGWESISDRDAVKKASKKIVHNVYKSYEPLRITAIAILSRMGINCFESNGQGASGILFNMSVLREVFLHNTIFSKLAKEIDAPSYNTETYTQIRKPYIIDDNKHGKRIAKPDFKIGNLIYDAKYKKHWGEAYDGSENAWKYARDDVFQVMSYMYLFACPVGGVVFPYRKKDDGETVNSKKYQIGIQRKDDYFYLVPFAIPKISDYMSFSDEMKKTEEKLIKDIAKVQKSKI